MKAMSAGGGAAEAVWDVSASEFAQAVVYFASDESAFTVGSELMIDGG